MATPSLLVIAPDIELRRSLEFALEAEGYAVTVRPAIDDARDLTRRFACTVLDAAATAGPVDDIIGFCTDFGPVVLLTDAPVPGFEGWIARIVEKPQLGEALSAAIKDVLHGQLTK